MPTRTPTDTPITAGPITGAPSDPEEPLHEVDHQWAVVQSEWYVFEPDADGVAQYDRAAATDETPRYVTFNGIVGALTGDNTLAMNVGEGARIYFINEGLALTSNFHPIGSRWDLVYPEGATHSANRVIRVSQTTLVAAGGATVVEIDGIVPQTILFVDHALARTFDKGALATIVVSGASNPEVFGVIAGGDNVYAGGDDGTDNPATQVEVVITAGAFDPANSENAYSPREPTIKVGTTVRWISQDAITHTITSGLSDGTTGSPDGLFDSGFLNEGDSWTFTFTEVGVFDYFCLPHPWMIGKVTVTE